MRISRMRRVAKTGTPRRPGARRGVATVELALVAPIFLLVVIGLIEFGRAMMVQQLLTNASREGARVAGRDSVTSASEVQSAVDHYLYGSRVSGATTTVSPNSLSALPHGDPVTVTVRVPYSRVSWMPSSWFLGGRTLTATSVMTRQP
jgi:Flp pilus assembly protein TadG